MRCWTAILVFALPAVGWAQPAEPRFEEKVVVRVMDLDVVVTDRQGHPVPDLKREDFTVRVEGQVVPIDYFARVDEGTIHAPDLAAASPDRLLAEYRKGEEAYVPRHFLIYIDLGHLAPERRNRALEALRDLVTRLGPTDSARVMVFDRRSKELAEWTTSKEAILSALSRVETSGVAMSRLQTERQTIRDIDSFSSRATRASLARQYAEQERAEVKRMLEDMDSELATLTPFPGKKAFLFVSGGFELQPGYAMSAYAAGILSLASFEVRSLSDEVDKLAKRANASEITFYTVDARGLAVEGISAAEDDPLTSRPEVSFLAREDSQAGLFQLARETGGLALVNTNDFEKGLSRVYQDVSSYYSIGVNLASLKGAQYRAVRVEVKQPGLTLRARRGYAVQPEEEQVADRTRATLKTNVSYQAIPVTLRTAPPSKEKRFYNLPISVTVPTTALTFVPQGGSATAAAEVYIGVIDDRGNMSPISREETTFKVPASEANSNSPVNYTATLKTRKGNYRVVVNVRDKATGRMGTAKANVRVE